MRNTKESTDTQSKVVKMVVPELLAHSLGSFLACSQAQLLTGLGTVQQESAQRHGWQGQVMAQEVSADSIQTHSLKDHRASK